MTEIEKLINDTTKHFTKHPAKKEAYLLKFAITQKAISYACKGLWEATKYFGEDEQDIKEKFVEVLNYSKLLDFEV